MDRLLFGDDEIDSLVRRFHAEINSDPKVALRTAKQLLSLARLGRGTRSWRSAWRGFALAAPAYRRLSRLEESQTCIDSASSLIWRPRMPGVSEYERDLAWSVVLLNMASLAKEFGDSARARFCLEGQHSLYFRMGAPYLGRNLIDQAIVLESAKAGWQAVAAKADEGLKQLEVEGGAVDEYRTAGLALHLYAVCEESHPGDESILRRLDELRELHAHDSPLARACFGWIAGRALMSVGRYHEGELRLERAAETFSKSGQPIRAARAALDLAFSYLANGESDKAVDLAGRLFPILSRLRHHKDAAAALIVFYNAAAEGTLTIAVLQKLRRQLERAS